MSKNSKGELPSYTVHLFANCCAIKVLPECSRNHAMSCTHCTGCHSGPRMAQPPGPLALLADRAAGVPAGLRWWPPKWLLFGREQAHQEQG